ncbi:MAG: hypothetical protein JRN22_00460 [Nitrososphaerota archaeon]|nr:hypothetical protein [Nitrososphaerota archaeon]
MKCSIQKVRTLYNSGELVAFKLSPRLVRIPKSEVTRMIGGCITC